MSCFYFSFHSLSVAPSKCQVIAACLSLVLSTIDIGKSNKQNELANRLTHMSLGFVLVSTFCNVIKMNFGLDPAV